MDWLGQGEPVGLKEPLRHVHERAMRQHAVGVRILGWSGKVLDGLGIHDVTPVARIERGGFGWFTDCWHFDTPPLLACISPETRWLE